MTNAPLRQGTGRQDLMQRLEKAKEGSRPLSDEVLVAFGWNTIEAGPRGPTTTKWLRPDNTGFVENRPDPTRNLQDAVDLVPEGWGWAAAELDQGKPSAVLTNREPQLIPGTFDPNPNKVDFRAKAQTPVLALVIAILKTMEAEGD